LPGSVKDILQIGLLTAKLKDPLVPFSTRLAEGDWRYPCTTRKIADLLPETDHQPETELPCGALIRVAYGKSFRCWVRGM
jgi:hypothetical protein